MAQRAQSQGKVTYREGDGVLIAIRPGPVEATASDVTLSWTDGETHGSAAMPLGDFRNCVAEGLIALAQPLVMPAAAGPPPP